MLSYTKYSDTELLALLQEGDRSAFTEIFLRYNKLLYSHAYNKLREKEEAQDIIHEVFFALWLKRAESIPKSNLIGYLFTAVRYKISDLLSHRSVQDKHLKSLGAFMDRDDRYADHGIREQQLQKIIMEEIAALPPRMQLVFKMSRYEELSYKEIAAKLDISEETVKDQIKKALRILKIRLGPFVMIISLTFFTE